MLNGVNMSSPSMWHTASIAGVSYFNLTVSSRKLCVVAEQETFSIIKSEFNDMNRPRQRLAVAMPTTASYIKGFSRFFVAP